MRGRLIMECAVFRQRPGLFVLGRGRDISGQFRRCAVGRCRQTWYMDVVIHVFGLYLVECGYTHWRIQESVFWGSFLAKGPSQGTPKTKNSTDLGQFLALRDPNSLPKNNLNNKMSHFPPARGCKLTWTSTRP